MKETSAQTIAAVSTAMSDAGIGIVRVSGDDAVAVVHRYYQNANGEHDLKSHGANTIRFGRFCAADEEVIDEVLVSVMRAPHSYTGEDVVEVNCHGGMRLLQRVLTVLTSDADCRLAQPGEFTKRAFLNGRIDLSQAEAVMDVIAAKSAFAARNAKKQLTGVLRRRVEAMRERILEKTAFIEAALDDPEHYDFAGFPEELSKTLCMLISECETLLDTAQEGQIRKEGIRTVIAGRPNAGKSSLFNRLLQEERAIVTEIAGTTRDRLEENVLLGDILLRLVDTAGLRKTQDPVEQAGVARTMDAVEEADLLLYLVDDSVPVDEVELNSIASVTEGKPYLLLLNKQDLGAASGNEETIARYLKNRETAPVFVRTSMKTIEADGLAELQERIADLFFHGAVVPQEAFYLTKQRHVDALSRALSSLRLVRKSVQDGMPEDFYTVDLMDAYAALGEIIGAQVADDLTDKIFSEFCMGK